MDVLSSTDLSRTCCAAVDATCRTRVLITTGPAAGHVRPTAPIAHDLVAAGHEVIWYRGRRFQRSSCRWWSATVSPISRTARVPEI